MRCNSVAICSRAFARSRRKLSLAIYRYPVKSLRGERLERAQVLTDGLLGDRTGALLIESGHARVGKAYRGKEDSRLHHYDRPEQARAAAADDRVKLRLAASARYFDDSPISLILAPWLADAERICECSLDVCRFRPNLFADEIIGADDEAALLGAVLAIGPDVRLRVTKRIERCVTITYDPDSDAVNPAILRALAQRRDAILGVYCEVLATGEISAEDTISRI